MLKRRILSSAPRRLWIAGGLLFVSTVLLRTWNIAETFELLGDQVLYWNIALRPWHDLPTGGGPSSVGGTTIGPAFIWTIWGIRHVVGPWTGNLPHAGGIGLSIIQSAADVALLIAIWKRFGSLALALAVTLFVATAPEDMSLSASIWNPPLAVAFIKVSIACILAGGKEGSLWSAAGATGAAVLAMQCHSSAVFFAAPAIVALPLRELLAGRRVRAAQIAGISLATVLLLEVPYFTDMAANRDKQTRPAVVVANVAYTIRHPGSLRLRDASRGFVNAVDAMLVRPWTFRWAGAVLVATAIIALIRFRHDAALASVTVVPPLAAVAGFSLWQGRFEFYWFMILMPGVALTVGVALTAWKPVAPVVSVVLLLLAVAAIPARFAYAQTINRLPAYGALMRGSQEIRRRSPEIRRIDIEFAVEPSTNTHFIYERVLGGRVTPSAPFAATIERTGHVRFTAVRDGYDVTGPG
jgi:hypothetical protein